MKLNTKKVNDRKTHEGAVAHPINKEQELRRSVLSCMLWEGEFYESGVSIAQRISELAQQVSPAKVAKIAIEARNEMKLRHVPLLLARELARISYSGTANLLEEIIQRPDELTEFLTIYWKEGKCPISSQVKKGLGRAFTKFNEYSLAKYNRKETIKLRDVLFLSHAKPKDKEQEILWKKLIDDELKIPDTWEVELSASTDKKASWERLLKEDKLGALALLRNLRNMKEADVDEELVFEALEKMNVDRVLPFRFIAAARYAPNFEPQLESALFKGLSEKTKWNGKTIILVDVSGSMDAPLSAKSDMTRMDAACGLAMCCRELCDNITVYTFSEDLVLVPSRRGFALRDAIVDSQVHWGTYLGKALEGIKEKYDRLIVITDEQSHDTVKYPKKNGYVINVASYKSGVGYGEWVHIDGFSESILNYIEELEKVGKD